MIQNIKIRDNFRWKTQFPQAVFFDYFLFKAANLASKLLTSSTGGLDAGSFSFSLIESSFLPSKLLSLVSSALFSLEGDGERDIRPSKAIEEGEGALCEMWEEIWKS